MPQLRKFLFSIVLICWWNFAAATVYLFYVAPTEDIKRDFSSCPNYIYTFTCNEVDKEYSYVLLDMITAIPFRKVAPLHLLGLYNELMTFDSPLRNRILLLKNLSEGRVVDTDIFLFDDRKSLNPRDACNPWYTVWGSGNLSTLWPSSDCLHLYDKVYHGRIAIGERAAEQIIKRSVGGEKALQQVLVHHFVHAQFANQKFLSELYKTEFIEECQDFIGEFNQYNELELINSYNTAFKEGMAIYLALDLNTASRDRIISFLNNLNYRYISFMYSLDKSNGQPIPNRIWYTGKYPLNDSIKVGDQYFIVSNQNKRFFRYHFGPEKEIGIYLYKWKDLHSGKIFSNPQTAAGYLSLFAEFFFEDQQTGFDFIFKTNGIFTAPEPNLRIIHAFINSLANELEEFARSQQGIKAEQNGELTSSMFVYALFDVLDHFTVNDKDFVAGFGQSLEPSTPISKPKALETYIAHRDAIKKLTCPYLDAHECGSPSSAMDIQHAVKEIQTYFRDPSRILR